MDETAINAHGVELLGTQFEDLGSRIVMGVDAARVSLEDIEGAAQ